MPGGRGGRRTGLPGGQYSNRTDLQNGARPVVPTGQAYGEAKQQQAVVDAIPQRPSTGAAPTGPRAPAAPLPGSLGAVDRPTERPNEPLTAGAPFGPGPGAGHLGLVDPSNVGQFLSDLAMQPGTNPEVAALATRAQGNWA